MKKILFLFLILIVITLQSVGTDNDGFEAAVKGTTLVTPGMVIDKDGTSESYNYRVSGGFSIDGGYAFYFGSAGLGISYYRWVEGNAFNSNLVTIDPYLTFFVDNKAYRLFIEAEGGLLIHHPVVREEGTMAGWNAKGGGGLAWFFIRNMQVSVSGGYFIGATAGKNRDNWSYMNSSVYIDFGLTYIF